MSRLQKRYKEEIVGTLQKNHPNKNRMQIPVLEKVVINSD